MAEKKARFEGREELVDTWKVPPERLACDWEGSMRWMGRMG